MLRGPERALERRDPEDRAERVTGRVPAVQPDRARGPWRSRTPRSALPTAARASSQPTSRQSSPVRIRGRSTRSGWCWTRWWNRVPFTQANPREIGCSGSGASPVTRSPSTSASRPQADSRTRQVVRITPR